jgi:hypothetical protein
MWGGGFAPPIVALIVLGLRPVLHRRPSVPKKFSAQPDSFLTSLKTCGQHLKSTENVTVNVTKFVAE